MKKVIILALISLNVLASNKDWNVRISPLQFLAGMSNVELGFALGSNFSLAAGAMIWNQDDALGTGYSVDASQYHARLDYWFSGAFAQGWYLSGLVSTLNITLEKEISNVDYEASTSYSGYKVLGGYRWMWENFNMELGYGYADYGATDKLTLKSSDGDKIKRDMPPIQGGTLEFNIGWSF